MKRRHDPDIDASVEAQNFLRVDGARLMAGVDSLDIGLAIWDANDRLVVCNEMYRDLLGRVVETVEPGLTTCEVSRKIYESGAAPPEFTSVEDFIAFRNHQHRSVQHSDEWRSDDNSCVRVSRTRLPNGDIVITRVDVTDLRRAHQTLKHQAQELTARSDELARLALVDPLTGLPNRSAWDRQIMNIKAQTRDAKEALAVIRIDVRGFKRINTSLGHAAGDATLREVAARLRAALSNAEILARSGGDEFLAAVRIAPDVATATSFAEELAGRLSRITDEPIRHHDKTCDCGVSIGVAFSLDAALDPEELVSDADIALEQSKSSGWNNFCVFDEAKQRAARQQRRLADDLAGAIATKAIIPYFQVKVDAKTLTAVGAETLARWRHPEFGILTPNYFLGPAEALKLTPQIDRLMLEQALAAQRAWAAQSLPTLSIAVNVSSNRLRDPNLLADLAALGAPAGALAFELLETSFLDDLDAQSRWNLDGLREMGVVIELDDFGTGHASVAAMLNIRPHRVKIDRSLVSTLAESGDRGNVVKQIISMVKALDIGVVAEGVEDLETGQILSELGCDELQGFAFGRPVPFEAFLADSGQSPELSATHRV